MEKVLRTPADMSLTLGPVLFNWDAEKWRDFYYKMADEAPVDRVVVGEIVCEKRSPFFTKYMPDVIERLAGAGKHVVLGSPILVMNARERQMVQDLVELAGDDLTVEANDISAVTALAGHSFAAGPFLNLYNEDAARLMQTQGANHISLPGELSLASIYAIAAAVSVPVEVFAFGRMPLAISARCYHARAHKLSKDGCQYVCARDPDGMDVDTLDSTPFLAVNGVQTMSYSLHNVISDLTALSQAGVTGLRLSPQDMNMVQVAEIFRRTLNGTLDPAEALLLLEDLVDGLTFSNGFLHGAEGFRALGGLAAAE